jgi:dienelactone hydrolase
VRIPVSVAKPDGDGPFPAIVVLHDCSGLGANSSGAPRRWARTLVERGYVVVTPDSFSTRGYPNGVCTEGTRGRIDVSPKRRADDAIEALAYARTLPYVDPRRVGVMGGSHGGTTTLATVGRADAGFSAGIALYPRCASMSAAYQPETPLLILIGELDDWTPAADCRRLASATPSIALKIYPGAHHSFDSPYPVRFVATRINPSARSGRGATTGGNAEAWADAVREATDFFARQLSRKE